MYTFLTKLRPTEEFRSDQVKFPEATPTDLWGWLNITKQTLSFTIVYYVRKDILEAHLMWCSVPPQSHLYSLSIAFIQNTRHYHKQNVVFYYNTY